MSDQTFKYSDTPYMHEVLAALGDSKVKMVTVKKGASVGFTTAVLQNVTGYVIDDFEQPEMEYGRMMELIEQRRKQLNRRK